MELDRGHLHRPDHAAQFGDAQLVGCPLEPGEEQLDGLHPGRRAAGQPFLVHLVAAESLREPVHHARPLPQRADDPVADTQVVLRQIQLGRAGRREVDPLGVGDPHRAVADDQFDGFAGIAGAGHDDNLPIRGRRRPGTTRKLDRPRAAPTATSRPTRRRPRRSGWSPPTRSSDSPAVRGSSSRASSTAATSSRGTWPRSVCSASVTTAGAGCHGQAAGSQDRPVQVARPDVVVRRLFGLDVGAEHLVVVGLSAGVGADRRHHQVAAHAGQLGGVGEQHRAAAVHGVLPGGAAARAGSGGEHHGIRAVAGSWPGRPRSPIPDRTAPGGRRPRSGRPPVPAFAPARPDAPPVRPAVWPAGARSCRVHPR